MQDHKEEIINTRKGFLGGSDSKMIQQCAELGTVPQSALKRLAVCKGIIEPEQFTNRAIEMGNYIEETVFNNLKSTDDRWQSNPRIVSTKYSRPNAKVLDHIDYMLQDDGKKVLTLAECKSTRTTFQQTRDEYKYQLCHHWLLGTELAKSLGDYKVVLMLVHYCTEGIDLDEPFEFDPERLTVKNLREMERLSKTYDLAKGMDVINDFLSDFNEYYTEDIDASYLPAEVKTEFDVVTGMLAEIKVREQRIDDFKKRLTAFMEEKGVKSIKTDNWSITYVAPTESASFDSKRYLNDYASKYPRKYKKLVSEYEKRSKRSSFVQIKVNSNNND